MEKHSLGQFLKKARSDKGYTLRDVEDLTGISNAYLSQLEWDKIKQPSPVWLNKLADQYEVPYTTLLSLAGYPVPNEENLDTSSFSARIGAVTESEEDALMDYLSFLRSKDKTKRRNR